eukprot:scaffold928_cov370-Prasinococcus_capsulatus_cf.AAC.25
MRVESPPAALQSYALRVASDAPAVATSIDLLETFHSVGCVGCLRYDSDCCSYQYCWSAQASQRLLAGWPHGSKWTQRAGGRGASGCDGCADCSGSGQARGASRPCGA